MNSNIVFNILEQADSTNNYAMDCIHSGLAKHGMAWFTANQTAGKGQRGKVWESAPGENIALTVVFEPSEQFAKRPFLFNMLISIVCRNVLNEFIKEDVLIKWSNDLIIRDRKAGGILIENIYRGSQWNWSVVGIGINANQTAFSAMTKKPISIKQVLQQDIDVELLAKKLYQEILIAVDTFPVENILNIYNQYLYKKAQSVTFKKDTEIFSTMVQHVDEQGQLHTSDEVDRTFTFGEIEWII